MNVYWTVALISTIIQFFPAKNDNKYNIRLIISLIPLFIFSASRLNFGLDYNTYESYFDGVKIFGQSYDSHMEIGYYLINKILPSFRSLLVLQSLLLCISYYLMFKWYIPSKYAWIGFTLLFINGPLTIFFMLSAIRNGIAISIMIIATHYIHKKKIIPFLILITIASLFHTSILIIAPIAYFIVRNKPISSKFINIWILIIIFIYISSSSFVLNYLDILINNYFQRYLTYFQSSKELNENAGVLAILFSLTMSSLLLVQMKNCKLSIKENMVLIFSLVFYLSFVLGSLNFRISQYFAPYFIISSILLLEKSNQRIYKTAYFIILVIYTIYAFQIWQNSPNFSYSIYYSIFS